MNWTNVSQSAGLLPPPPNQTSSIQPSPASSYQNHQTSAAVTSSGRLQNSSTVKDEEKWWFEGKNCWYPFGDIQQIALEDNYQNGKKKKFDIVINNFKYTINFQIMQQVQKNDPLKRRCIRRDTEATIATSFPPRPNGNASRPTIKPNPTQPAASPSSYAYVAQNQTSAPSTPPPSNNVITLRKPEKNSTDDEQQNAQKSQPSAADAIQQNPDSSFASFLNKEHNFNFTVKQAIIVLVAYCAGTYFR